MEARHRFVYHKRVKLGGKVERKYEKEEYKYCCWKKTEVVIEKVKKKTHRNISGIENNIKGLRDEMEYFFIHFLLLKTYIYPFQSDHYTSVQVRNIYNSVKEKRNKEVDSESKRSRMRKKRR